MCMEGFADKRVPDGVKLWGVRMFTIRADGLLIGKYLEPFEPGEVNVARCVDGPWHKQKVPYRKCSSGCGFWCFWSGVRWVPEPDYVYLAAQVEASGKIVAGPDGFRAERMRLLGISALKHSWRLYAEGCTLSVNTRPGVSTVLAGGPLGKLSSQVSKRYGVPLRSAAALSREVKDHNWGLRMRLDIHGFLPDPVGLLLP